MWIKTKYYKNDIIYINSDKIKRMIKGKVEDCELWIDMGGDDEITIHRKTESEIDKIIQALIGEETIKEVE